MTRALQTGVGAAFVLIACAALFGEPRSRAIGAGGATIVEDFDGIPGAWRTVSGPEDPWAVVLDAASPSAGAHVLAAPVSPGAARAAFLESAAVSGSVVVSSLLKGSAGGRIGLTLGHVEDEGAYVAVRLEVGGSRVEVVRYPDETVLATADLPGGDGCAVPPTVPAGSYVGLEVEADASAATLAVRYEGALVTTVPIPAELAGSSHAGAHAAGAGAARFEDFTIEADEIDLPASAAFDLDLASPGAPLPETMFGSMMGWFATSNGLDPDAATADAQRDTFERLYQIFPLIADLGLTTLRFPGGLVANTYRWKSHVGNFYERPPGSELTLDTFLLLAESLGARPIITVNASDIPFGGGTFEGAREAADLVEYLTIPDDGSNPDPDGLAPDDPDNVDWARVRALNGHRAPFDIAGFEVGNELRGPPYLSAPDPAYAYAVRFIEFAGAMKAVNPAIVVGAVGKDSPQNPTYLHWYETVSAELEAADCDWLPADGIAVLCHDFWLKHLFLPNYWTSPSGAAVGVRVDRAGASFESAVEVPFGATWRVWFGAHSYNLGDWPQVRVEVDGGGALDQTIEVDNFAPLSLAAWPDIGLYPSDPIFLTAGAHTVRATRLDPGGFGNRTLNLYPVLALVEDVPTDPAIVRADLRNGGELWRILQALPSEYPPFVLYPEPSAPGELFGRPVWVTEVTPAYETIDDQSGIPQPLFFEPPLDPGVGGLRDMLLEAHMRTMLADLGIAHQTNLQLFDDILASGLIEGVGKDIVHGDELGWQRIGSAVPPRMRPRGMLLGEMARRWRGARVPVATNEVETYSAGGDAVQLGKLGAVAVSGVPTVHAFANVESARGLVHVTVINAHESAPAEVSLAIAGAAAAPGAAARFLTGDDPGANNEPEPDVCSHPGPTPGDPCVPGVVALDRDLVGSEGGLRLVVAPHSVAFVEIPLAGGDLVAPAAPDSFAAFGDASAGGIRLEWDGSGAEPVTFDVYRSVHFEPSDLTNDDPSDTVVTPCLGPWEGRINPAPLADPVFVDAAIDAGRVYCYGVRAVDAAGNRSEMATLRKRATVEHSLAPATFSMNPEAVVLGGTFLANVAADLLDVAGVPPDEDFLQIRPGLQLLIPPLGNILDLTIETEPFAGDPADLVVLDLVLSLRFKTPVVLAEAEVFVRNHAAGGEWEPVGVLAPALSFLKATMMKRILSPEEYLSPEGTVEVRIDTRSGDLYQALFLEHLRVDLEAL